MFIKLQTKEAEHRYKVYKNKLTDVIRNSKKLYYKKVLYENKNNIKGTWYILNSLIKQESTKIIYPDYFIDKNGENHNLNDIVNSFNHFFVNVGPNLAAKIPDQEIDVLNGVIKRNQHSIFLSATNEQEVKIIVHKCKNKLSTDCHDVDMALVKKVINNISKPLTYICNLSFQTGCVPSKMKIAKVIPLYKNDNKHNLTNYRPISLLPQFSKILEKLFNSRSEKFIDKYQIINEGQNEQNELPRWQ